MTRAITEKMTKPYCSEDQKDKNREESSCTEPQTREVGGKPGTSSGLRERGTRLTDNTSRNRDRSSPHGNWNTKRACDISSSKNDSPSAKKKNDSNTPSKVLEGWHSGKNIETATGQVERQNKMPPKLAHVNLELEKGEDEVIHEPIPLQTFNLSGYEITSKQEELEEKNGTILGSQGNSLVFPAVQCPNRQGNRGSWVTFLR